MRKGKVFLSAMLLSAMILSALGGCGAANQTVSSQDETGLHDVSTEELVHTNDLTKPVLPEKKNDVKYGLKSFSAELFKKQYEAAEDKKENVFLSPFSVYAALSMVQLGADGETREVMENVLGCDEKNESSFFKKYMNDLSDDNKSSLSVANSLWINEESEVVVKENYINKVRNFYNAEVFYDKPTPETTDKINQWANDKTKGMIPSILNPDALNENMLSVLLNAVCFDAEWCREYYEDEIADRTFNNYDGSTCEIPFMNSTEGSYIEDDHSEGFIKYYKNGDEMPRYAFVAILPKEDVTIDDYVSQYYQADTINSLIDNIQSFKVEASMPKYEIDTKYELPATLNAMGLGLIFDKDNANFREMADDKHGNVSVNRVIHKAHIEVDEHGTKAAAVTAIDTVTNTAVPQKIETRVVILDRPFVFAIYDYEEKIPLFIGVYKTAEN